MQTAIDRKLRSPQLARGPACSIPAAVRCGAAGFAGSAAARAGLRSTDACRVGAAAVTCRPEAPVIAASLIPEGRGATSSSGGRPALRGVATGPAGLDAVGD